MFVYDADNQLNVVMTHSCVSFNNNKKYFIWDYYGMLQIMVDFFAV